MRAKFQKLLRGARYSFFPFFLDQVLYDVKFINIQFLH